MLNASDTKSKTVNLIVLQDLMIKIWQEKESSKLQENSK